MITGLASELSRGRDGYYEKFNKIISKQIAPDHPDYQEFIDKDVLTIVSKYDGQEIELIFDPASMSQPLPIKIGSEVYYRLGPAYKLVNGEVQRLSVDEMKHFTNIFTKETLAETVLVETKTFSLSHTIDDIIPIVVKHSTETSIDMDKVIDDVINLIGIEKHNRNGFRNDIRKSFETSVDAVENRLFFEREKVANGVMSDHNHRDKVDQFDFLITESNRATESSLDDQILGFVNQMSEYDLRGSSLDIDVSGDEILEVQSKLANIATTSFKDLENVKSAAELRKKLAELKLARSVDQVEDLMVLDRSTGQSNTVDELTEKVNKLVAETYYSHWDSFFAPEIQRSRVDAIIDQIIKDANDQAMEYPVISFISDYLPDVELTGDMIVVIPYPDFRSDFGEMYQRLFLSSLGLTATEDEFDQNSENLAVENIPFSVRLFDNAGLIQSNYDTLLKTNNLNSLNSSVEIRAGITSFIQNNKDYYPFLNELITRGFVDDAVSIYVERAILRGSSEIDAAFQEFSIQDNNIQAINDAIGSSSTIMIDEYLVKQWQAEWIINYLDENPIALETRSSSNFYDQFSFDLGQFITIEAPAGEYSWDGESFSATELKPADLGYMATYPVDFFNTSYEIDPSIFKKESYQDLRYKHFGSEIERYRLNANAWSNIRGSSAEAENMRISANLAINYITGLYPIFETAYGGRLHEYLENAYEQAIYAGEDLSWDHISTKALWITFVNNYFGRYMEAQLSRAGHELQTHGFQTVLDPVLGEIPFIPEEIWGNAYWSMPNGLQLLQDWAKRHPIELSKESEIAREALTQLIIGKSDYGSDISRFSLDELIVGSDRPAGNVMYDNPFDMALVDNYRVNLVKSEKMFLDEDTRILMQSEWKTILSKLDDTSQKLLSHVDNVEKLAYEFGTIYIPPTLIRDSSALGGWKKIANSPAYDLLTILTGQKLQFLYDREGTLKGEIQFAALDDKLGEQDEYLRSNLSKDLLDLKRRLAYYMGRMVL